MRTPNLYLHCGAAEVPRTELAAVALPAPTKSHFPIGHDMFVDLVEDKLREVGFRFGVQAHSLTHDGNRYFGLAHLLNGTSEEQEHAMVVGLRNSMDKSFAASLVFGSQVFVCDNLAFTGEIKIARKHTPHILEHLPNLVTAAVAQTAFMRDNQERRFEHYRDSPITTRRADHLIIEMLRRGVINTQRVEKVVSQWDEPDHDFGGRSAWRLFNAATEVLKTVSLVEKPGRTIELQAILDQFTGFVPKMPIEGQAERLN